MTLKTHVVAGIAFGVAVVLLASTGALSQTAGRPEKFTAFAVNLNSNTAGTNTATVEITVNRWSSDTERKTLTETLLQKGQDALLKALQDQRPVGRIRTPDSLGYDMRYAHQDPGEDGGRRIILATDRPISYWEIANATRSVDYPFTLIELRMRNDGTGEGKMSLATKITVVGNDTIALENYDQQPVLLQSVRSSVATH